MTILSNTIKARFHVGGLSLRKPGQQPAKGLPILGCLLLTVLAGCANTPDISPSAEQVQSRQQRQADATARESQTDPAAALREESPAVKQLLTDAETARQDDNLSLANLLLERALRIAPSHANTYLGLARLRMDQSLPTEALAFVQRGLALQPQPKVKTELQATGIIAKEAISDGPAPLGS